MKSKLLSAVLGCALVMGLAACGGDPAPSYSEKVLADADHNCYVVMGDNAVGETDEVAKDLAWDYTEQGKMTATSVLEISKKNVPLANTLNEKPLAALYYLENVRLGTKLASWTSKCVKGQEVLELNGSYCVKTGSVNYDPEDDVYSVDEWIPSPEHYTENLTPASLYMPPHSEEKDAAGNDHNANPMAFECGLYTVVVARYSKAVGDSFFGLGLIKTQSLLPPTPPQTYVVDHLSVVGVIGGEADWDMGIRMVEVDTNAYMTILDLKAGDQIKVRANDAWDYSWGAGVLAAGEGYIDNDENITIEADGSYALGIELTGKDLLVEGAKNAVAMSMVSANPGSEVNPYTVGQALAHATEVFGETPSETAYEWADEAGTTPVICWVKGYVKDVVCQYDTNSGLTFTLVDDEGNELLCYNIFGLDAEQQYVKYNKADKEKALCVGDYVHAAGTLEAYVKSGSCTIELARPTKGKDGSKIDTGWCGFEVVEEKLSLSLIGSISGTVWDTDFMFNRTSFDGLNFEVTFEFHAGEEFKVRVGCDWTVSYGASIFESLPETLSGQGDSNISVVSDCTITFALVAVMTGGELTSVSGTATPFVA